MAPTPPNPKPPVADDVEPRLRAVERAADRLEGRVGHIEMDMAAFRPIPLENASYRAETTGSIKALSDDVHEAFVLIRSLTGRFDEFIADTQRMRESREEKEREREKAEQKERDARAQVERRDRWQRWATVMTLSLAFVSMTVGWVVLAF